ncbi:MAG: hypothetical protein PHT71_01305, partial [Victivallaceae bacterium]|nr:hypothetical protein [Victivallaceae bacterium]
MAINYYGAFDEWSNNDDDIWEDLSDHSDTYTLAIDDDGDGFVDDEWVGYGDAVDYRKLELDFSGSYNFTISGQSYGGGFKYPISLTIYEEVKTGKLKKLKNITVQKYTGPGSIEGLLLDDSNVYYLQVKAPGHKKAENSQYQVNVTGEVFNHAGIKDGDDNWEGLAGYDLEIDANGNGSLNNEWVGYGDAVDYRNLVLDSSGLYHFSISGSGLYSFDLDSTVRMTIHEEVNSKLKRLKTITVKANSGNGSIKGLLLDENKNYYLQVEAPAHAKGESTAYEVYIHGDAFNHDGINDADDEWEMVRDHPEHLYNFKITADGTGQLDNEWVGFGDAEDYRKLDLTHSGSYNFTISDVTNTARVTIYEMYNNRGTDQLKRLKTITVNPRF